MISKKFKNKLRGFLAGSVLTVVIFTFQLKMAAAEKIGIFYDRNIPQHEFAANDIKSALEGKGFSVDFAELSNLSKNYTGKKVVIALAYDNSTKTILNSQGGKDASVKGEQAYALRTTTSPSLSYWVLGADNNGAMYGALQMAEYFSFDGFSGIYNEEESPYLKLRGIKFNIPLDKDCPTYFYNNGGTSHKQAIRDVWDMDFWKTWFDEMARNRYNVLSLWSPHPFTAMINMEDEYPGIAIQGVTGYDENGKEVQINNWNIDRKTEFWQKVMKYGKDRGFSIYFCTWNIFLSTAEGKHGLTDKPGNQNTRLYLRKCTKKFFESYPDLAGFGITVGERMGGITSREKEEWSWDTYGRGMMEYALANPNKDLVFIHRQHQGNVSDMLYYFKQLSDLPNVRFDLSFKYSQAHAYAAVKPNYWDRGNKEDGHKGNMAAILDANNLKSWLTVRNDDFYFLHWADPQFVRDYVNHFPDVEKYVNAFYIGSDGWVFTKAFINKDPYYKERDMLSIQQTWYMQKLWGRISYNPSISDNYFKKCLAVKYPEVDTQNLFEVWSSASKAIQRANEQVTGTWDLDFKWWPEGWTSEDGFRSLTETRKALPMNGSTLCSFEQTATGECEDKTSAASNAAQIEQLANRALDVLKTMKPGLNRDLELTLKNLEAMANLSLYNSFKFQSAIFLEQDKKEEALSAIGKAYCYWKNYTNLMDNLFIPVDLQRNLDFKNWHEHDKDALQDYLDLGGKGEPDCPGN